MKNTVSVDGKLLAVPTESQSWGVLYNKDIFQECNITPPDTLSELKTVCETLEGKGYKRGRRLRACPVYIPQREVTIL